MLERHADKHEDVKEFVLALLIFEDIFAPLILTVAPFIIQDEPIEVSDIGKVFAGFLIFGVLLFIGSRFVKKQPKIAKHLLRQDDASIGLIGLILFCAGIGIVFGLSEILGAFIAGIMLAGIHDVRPLKRLTVPVRDLFLPIFFISFGISINLEQVVIVNTLFFVLIVWGRVIEMDCRPRRRPSVWPDTCPSQRGGFLARSARGVLDSFHGPIERGNQPVRRTIYFRLGYHRNRLVPLL